MLSTRVQGLICSIVRPNRVNRVAYPQSICALCTSRPWRTLNKDGLVAHKHSQSSSYSDQLVNTPIVLRPSSSSYSTEKQPFESQPSQTLELEANTMPKPEPHSEQHSNASKGIPKKKKKGIKAKKGLRHLVKVQANAGDQSADSVMMTETISAKTVTMVKKETRATVKTSAKASREKRHPPSQESGGIPEPTVQYLLQSHAPSSPLSEPRRILVVMDLNGTLLYRPYKRRPFHFIERPHAKSFLNYCLNNFYVAIWSSARPDNVEKMVERLLTPQQVKKCILVWGRDKFGLSAADYDSRVQCYKRLTRIWSDPQVKASFPATAPGGRWDQSNTVLVDDSREKARSEPHNILEIPDFAGLAGEPANVLPQVHDYINSLCYQSNVSGFIKEHPFKLNPEYKLAL